MFGIDSGEYCEQRQAGQPLGDNPERTTNTSFVLVNRQPSTINHQDSEVRC
jgi:hypothetical protein